MRSPTSTSSCWPRPRMPRRARASTSPASLPTFVVTATEADAIKMSLDPNVELVQQNGRVYASATQNNATWGIDRVDQRDLPLSRTYTYSNEGEGVTAYIIDTGIRRTHNE